MPFHAVKNDLNKKIIQFLQHLLYSSFLGKVDILYLDNTYCSPDCVFPTREEATSSIIAIMERHSKHDIVIAMRNLGKEDLLCKIALHFQEWISVPDKFYKTLEVLGAPDVFDNSSVEHRIRVVPFHLVSNKFVSQVNENQPTIVILPTALYQGIDAKPYENNSNVFVVPYSDHSSFTELRNFVSFIKPRKIIPVVKAKSRGPFGLNIADRADMSVFSHFVKGDWTSKIEIPLSVQAFMHPRSNKLQSVVNKGLKRKATVKVSHAKKAKRGVTYESPKCIASGPTESTDEILVKSLSLNENEKENLSFGKNSTQQVKRSLFDKTVNVDKKSGDFGSEYMKEKCTEDRGSENLYKQDETLPIEKSILKNKGLKKVKVKNKGLDIHFTDRKREGEVIDLCSQTGQHKVSEGKARGTYVINGKHKGPNIIEGVNKEKTQRNNESVRGDTKAKYQSICNHKNEMQYMKRNHNFIRTSKNKEKCVSLRKEDTENGKEMPESDEECGRVYAVKRVAVKMPKKCTASKPDDKFRETFGMKSYSRTSQRKRSSVSQVSKEQLAVEKKREMQMRKTAEWVLKTVNYNASQVSEGQAKWNEINEEDKDIDTLKCDTAYICENKKEQLKLSSKAVASDDLKQATLSKYFRKSNEDSSISDAHDEIFENLGEKQQEKKFQIQNQLVEEEGIRSGENTEDSSVSLMDIETLEENIGNIGSQLGHKISTACVKTECRHNVSDDSVKAQVGTQVQRSEVNFESSITAEKINEEKFSIMKDVTEVEDTLDTSSESVIAQVGTQMNSLSRHSRFDGLTLKLVDIKDKHDKHEANKKSAEESREETRDDSENKSDMLETKRIERNFEKISENLHPGKQDDSLNEDLSILVNVGTQTNIRKLRGTDTCNSKVDCIKVKQHRKSRICCKQCELEAFKEAFKQLKISYLKETKSVVKTRKLKLKTHKNAFKSAGNVSFKVKPVNG